MGGRPSCITVERPEIETNEAAGIQLAGKRRTLAIYIMVSKRGNSYMLRYGKPSSIDGMQ